ncbi:MAG TPA: M1 family metallopeptidase [Gemmatimonadales bacterium]|nr:M1 family metallopeptidase [Gemmatimonadales bacterium]
MIVAALFLAVAWQQPTAAQAPAPAPRPLPVGVPDTSPFRRLELPAATTIRTGAGAPGRDYWQQRVDYSIKAQLDTTTHTVSGTETVRYKNRSPDSLRYVWFQVDQNIYQEGSRADYLNPPGARFAARGFSGGYTISELVAVRGAEPGHGDTPVKKVALATTANGTMLRADLDRGLPPGGTATFEIAFKFQVPEHGSDRMGRQQYGGHWLYEIAEWYPRVAVYDDVRGWNTEQYLGQGEFYLEYGDIDFALTVPRNFVVAASGTLLNPLEVLTGAQRTRLAQAVKSDSTVTIIGRDDAGSAATRPTGPSGTLTWKFSAKNVRDVAWAAAPNFIWDASGWNGILMQSFYPPQADTGWSRSTVYVRHTIKHYSEKWFPYPYPTAINVAGPVGGMEYPMIVFCGSRASGRNLFGVTTHELGHQWFPMTVGSNERLFAWMDEGFNTFINIYSELAFYHDSLPRGAYLDQWAQFAKTGYDVPPMLPADRVSGMLLGQAAYNKPAIGLYLLRHDILADSTRFDAAFREYIRRWAFKHPTPSDFFRSMEDGLGEDLSWFWRGWFYRSDVVDIAVDSVKMHGDSTGRTAWVYLSSPGQLPMPVDLRLTYADSSTQSVRLPVEIWYLGNHHVYVKPVKAEVTKVEADPLHAIPDVRRENNVWAK